MIRISGAGTAFHLVLSASRLPTTDSSCRSASDSMRRFGLHAGSERSCHLWRRWAPLRKAPCAVLGRHFFRFFFATTLQPAVPLQIPVCCASSTDDSWVSPLHAPPHSLANAGGVFSPRSVGRDPWRYPLSTVTCRIQNRRRIAFHLLARCARGCCLFFWDRLHPLWPPPLAWRRQRGTRRGRMQRRLDGHCTGVPIPIANRRARREGPRVYGSRRRAQSSMVFANSAI